MRILECSDIYVDQKKLYKKVISCRGVGICHLQWLLIVFFSDHWKQSARGRSQWRRCDLMPIGKIFLVFGNLKLMWNFVISITRNLVQVYVDLLFPMQHLIDLAGSESSKTETTGLRRKEGSYINKSLLTLGTVRLIFFSSLQ